MTMKQLWAVVLVVTLGAGCCATAIRYRNFQDPKNKVVKIKPEVRVQIEQMDRMELYVGGNHVGTLFFDGSGSVFVGDGEKAAGVLQELLTYLEMFKSYFEREQGGTYY